jgi:uncharacterized protein YkwD
MNKISLTVATALAAAFFTVLSAGGARAQTIGARGYGAVALEPAATAAKTSAGTESRFFGLEREAFALVNRKRAESGLEPLVWSDEAAGAARLHSENMARLGFFSHAGRDGSRVEDRAEAAGLTGWRALGENIAFNRGFQNPVETAVEKWMLSAGHRQNILSERWRETGVGIALKADGSYYLTQVFVTR